MASSKADSNRFTRMAPSESIARESRMRLLGWAPLAALVLVAFVNALPHVHESIWQDEAVTLDFFASHGIFYPFTHYSLPNNHIAFSAMLSAWLDVVPRSQITWLRALPLGLFLLSVPAVFAAARRMAGPAAGVIAALLFASSSVSGNFATQLRGYAPSWLFAALALRFALDAGATRHRVAWRVGYALATLVLVWMLPTNVYFAEVIGAGVALCLVLHSREPRAQLPAAALLFLAPPLAFLVAYGPIWIQVAATLRAVGTGWTRPGLLLNWTFATLSDFLWLLPLVLAGMAIAIWQRREAVRAAAGTGSPWLLPLLLLLGLAISLAAMPSAPFPRTLVPYLPLWYVAVASFAGALPWRTLRRPAAAIGALALCAAGAGLVHAGNLPSCRAGYAPRDAYDYDLCYQYFRDRYQPEAVIAAWAAIGFDEIPIATNFEGYHALRALGSRALVFEYRHPPAVMSALPLVVAHDDEEMRAMLASMGLSSTPYALQTDTGWYKVYAPQD